MHSNFQRVIRNYDEGIGVAYDVVIDTPMTDQLPSYEVPNDLPFGISGGDSPHLIGGYGEQTFLDTFDFDDRNLIQKVGDYILFQIISVLSEVKDWLIEGFKVCLKILLENGFILLKIGLIAMITFQVCRILINHRREESLKQSYVYGIGLFISMYLEKVILNLF